MTILDDILVQTRQTIATDRRKVSASDLRDRVTACPPARDFHAALAATDAVRLIAEVKRSSPSAGLIRADFDPPTIAKSYRAGGAACISVLTDAPFFGGHLDFLTAVRATVDLPVLRKDFIVDEYQLLQARVAGADAVLLIAECLSPTQLSDLTDAAFAMGLQTLTELYEPSNLDAVLDTQTRLVGINNRNLHNFDVDLRHCIRVAADIPADRLVVGESGIRTPQDVALLAAGGIKAILVGESLMRQPNIELATRMLLEQLPSEELG